MDKEMQNRQALAESEAKELGEVLPYDLLAQKHRLAEKEEGKAHLQHLGIQSYMTEYEVRRQRLLQRITALPEGFSRCYPFSCTSASTFKRTFKGPVNPPAGLQNNPKPH